jgi:hypothetical protein
MIGLEDEFSKAVCSLTPERIDRLRAAGVHERAIFHTPLLVGMAPIQTHRGGLYDVDATAAAWAILLPCGEWDGLNWQLVDICAFHPDQPDKWYRRRGAADVLGVIDHFSMQPRRLHRRPIDWLVDEGRGLCVLDWGRNPVDLLRAAGPLMADRFLENRLRKVAVKAAAAHVKDLVSNG